MSNVASINKKRFLLVIAVFAIPVLISYLAYYVWQPQGAVRNYGELIPVQTLAETVTLKQVDGQAVSAQALRGKWLLVMLDAGTCDAACEKKLYAMRQVRLMQGREQDRIQRVWLSSEAIKAADGQRALIEGVMVLRDTQGNAVSQFTAPVSVKRHIYLVDPLGNIMLRWPEHPDLKRMHKDLERLLKYSQIG